MHGTRSCYHSGLYEDDYGESYRYHRGKPLVLNINKYNAMRDLWIHHKIASEVAYKRSTSSRVVILNYY